MQGPLRGGIGGVLSSPKRREVLSPLLLPPCSSFSSQEDFLLPCRVVLSGEAGSSLALAEEEKRRGRGRVSSSLGDPERAKSSPARGQGCADPTATTFQGQSRRQVFSGWVQGCVVVGGAESATEKVAVSTSGALRTVRAQKCGFWRWVRVSEFWAVQGRGRPEACPASWLASVGAVVTCTSDWPEDSVDFRPWVWVWVGKGVDGSRQPVLRAAAWPGRSW